jgi:FG-GAP repeat
LAWPRPASQPTAVQQDAGLRADFNQDGFADLAVGAAFEAVGSLGQAGVVTVLYGTANGTSGTGSQQFTQVAGATEAGDLFGSALASGDFNQDGFADLAASAPGEDVGSTPDAGAVSVLYGSAAGLTVTGGRLFTQAGGAIEREDRFGTALASPTSTMTGSPTWPPVRPANPRS